MKPVVRHLVRLDVSPDIIVAPIDERVDLDHRVALVPLDRRGVCACDRLLLAQARHPGTRIGKRALQRLDLADTTALAPVVHALAEGVEALLPDERFDLLAIGEHYLDGNVAVLKADVLHDFVSLVVQTAGIEREHADLRRVLRDDVLKRHVLGAEAVRELDRRAERLACPTDDLFRRLLAELSVQPLSVLWRVSLNRFTYHSILLLALLAIAPPHPTPRGKGGGHPHTPGLRRCYGCDKRGRCYRRHMQRP